MQILFCGMLILEFIQYSSWHSRAFAVKLFLYALSQNPCGASI